MPGVSPMPTFWSRHVGTPRSYFEMEGGPEPAGGLTVTTENKMLA